jgi:predicted  nucleic acid-binding Zn-ribbon protein
MTTNLDYHNMMLSIQRIDIAMTNLSEKVLKIDLNSTDINGIEKNLIEVNHDLSDIRKDVKFLDERFHSKIIAVEDNILKIQQSINNLIDAQNDSLSFLPKMINKNFVGTTIIAIIILTIVSNNDTKQVIFKLLSIFSG